MGIGTSCLSIWVALKELKFLNSNPGTWSVISEAFDVRELHILLFLSRREKGICSLCKPLHTIVPHSLLTPVSLFFCHAVDG